MVASFIFRLRSSIIENVAICMASNICISFDSGSSIGAKWRKSSLPAAAAATVEMYNKEGERERMGAQHLIENHKSREN